MLIREITVKEDKDQLDEIIFGGLGIAALAGIAYGLVSAWAMSEAFDFLLGRSKIWMDDLRMKNFKPNGDHIPNHTELLDGKKRYLYKAATGKWFEADGNSGTKTKGNPVTISSENFEKGLLAKKVKFLDKIATLQVMQSTAIGVPGSKKYISSTEFKKFNKTGTTLADKISDAQDWDKSKWTSFKSKVGGVFSLRMLGSVSFIMPVYAAHNTLALKAVYQERLKLGKEKGHRDILTGGVYNTQSYDRDIKLLRDASANYIAMYLATSGGAAMATGVFWLYYLSSRKNKLVSASTVKRFPYIGKLFKLAQSSTMAVGAAVGVGAVGSSLNEDLARKLGGVVANGLLGMKFNDTGSTDGEYILNVIFGYFDSNFDKVMTQLGFGSTAANAVQSNLEKNNDYNPLKRGDNNGNGDGDGNPLKRNPLKPGGNNNNGNPLKPGGNDSGGTGALDIPGWGDLD